ncbi:hypothetical protein ACF06D_09965 [Streptomyces griseoluteus]|uniref:Uncharacterized protein n=1 Tax=Streptomyces griseoluteus TaxID=29306 RepID=A0A4Z1DN30_STRGP|nr:MULTISPECIES: hypothetical protein [Streptomyces]TGN85609.1 hypothetical protein E5082_05745 [Streptomyces griseoluteus]WST04380.1 hypothetical protein OG448_20880 [Streptomyces sp. NBC_01171]
MTDNRIGTSVRRWDRHGREHVVRVERAGLQRTFGCGTCGWRRGTRHLPWTPTDEHPATEHLAEAHQATLDPARR